MITVTSIFGTASDSALAEKLHDLEHKGRVEVLTISGDDALRRRLRGTTDKGTDVAIALERGERLVDGAVLLLDDQRAIVLRTAERHWLKLMPSDGNAAIELGYCAGNHHWKVSFVPGALLVALQGPAEHYLARLEPLVKSGRVQWSSE